MSAEERLRSIVSDGLMRAFPPYGTEKPCISFSETTIGHLRFLLGKRGYCPWGIVLTRRQVLRKGGGTVAYIQDDQTLRKFRSAGLNHWVVRTDDSTDWTHEREWRIPWLGPRMRLHEVRAILIPDETWRPSPQDEQQPELWTKSPIWVWRAGTKKVGEFPPGMLV
ncbi:hypothetical protein [Streptomyces californicus]|uniref:hypothetical protein n=1 Tax=Streptomyces californicus TaxID=67351 RepID=UPI00364C56E9